MDRITIPRLQEMKRQGRKIVGVVAWDTPMAQIADRAGVDLVSVGDSVGKNLWGHATENEVTVDELLIVCKAVRRGVKRALLSCDLPATASPEAAMRFVKEGGADMIKVNGTPDTVRAMVRSGIAVFAEFHGGGQADAELVARAKALEQAGAAVLDFRHSGPEAGAAVAKAVSIPVIGGLGGGPWLDGRMRMAHAAIGYAASWLDSSAETYANVARTSLEALSGYAADVRAGRQIKGQRG
jgi:3-methyl-2-oxobutanoate hydroxymethyltransferase